MFNVDWLLNLSRWQKRLISIFVDVIGLLFIVILAIWLRLGNTVFPLTEYVPAIVLLPLLSLPVFIKMGLYRAVVRYISHRFVFVVFSAGLILSVVVTIIPDLSKIVNVMTLPLMLLSGAILPLQFLSHGVQQILLFNPIAHGIEFLRLNYFQGYWSVTGIDIAYLYAWILPMLALGLMLHIRFELKLKQK